VTEETEEAMHTVHSLDGTKIAYDQQGEGPAVILVNGALGYRKFKLMTTLTDLLSERCTVFNYDRRGRGDSNEAGPFAVEREIEDIAALIDAAGGRASLWGFSSGGALALRAAGAGIGVEKLGVYEVPFMVDPHDKMPTADYGQRLDELVAAGDRRGAVNHFMRNAMGIPAPVVAAMRLMPMFKQLSANAMTLPYDWAALGQHNMRGEPLRSEEFASVTVPTLVVHGAKSPTNLQKGSRALADVLPDAELRSLAGASHNLKARALAPMLLEFFASSIPAVA
jgi:pimeloyl-ACP methyl ester carboxylesterase